MLWEGRSVLEPVTKKPIQVRIGIHSGPIVAGVVALSMPRFGEMEIYLLLRSTKKSVWEIVDRERGERISDSCC
ncbi:hypothetical protein ANCDUO_21433 [Ancylostoma duodenale]|uniref:Guanylate cyclase domain-containing protein n=1 Tax=Ancylostoma duodenale TaxID=51022 RepID=A0A0C2CFE0_9BILA|nr:hypothetical protein ANCDUO_21433 [Ancylostoma duodenale]